MLQLTIPISPEGWDEEKEEFVEPKTVVLELEHSLLSISKWESKWCKAFLTGKEKTHEELLDYIKCMTLTPNVSSEVYDHLTREHIEQIDEYLAAPMTASVITEEKGKGGAKSSEVTTSELIYYWMTVANLPFEVCEKWHLNRLLMLIKVCSVKNSPQKKMSKKAILQQNRAINEARKKQYNTKG